MNELPPDAARLRAILEHLERQVADNEAVGIYLRLQRDAVRQALAGTDEQPAPRPAGPSRNGHRVTGAPSFAPNRGGRQSTGFCVERQRRAIGPEPVRIHLDDCSSAVEPLPITAQDARAALLDPNVIACAFCRPDTELGIDVD